MNATINWNGTPVQLEYETLGPGIVVYKNSLKQEWDLVNRIEAALAKEGTRFAWRDARVGFESLNTEHRRCKDFKLAPRLLGEEDEYSKDLFEVDRLITEALEQCLQHYSTLYRCGIMKFHEVNSVVRYGMGEYFNEHSDDGHSYRCVVSAVGYPNDDYEGGELTFSNFNVKYKATAGDFVIMPSNYVYAHKAEPVLDDKFKYAFVIMNDRNAYAHRDANLMYASDEEKAKYL
jgi:2OG-Fe(II) oxygenase superfamily